MGDSVKISDEIIKMVSNEIGVYPSFVHTPQYTHDGFLKLTQGSKKMWVNEYVDEKEIVRFEGLYDYKGSGIFIYYTCEDKKYRFIFMSDIDKTDTLIFTIKALNKYKIQIPWN
jgi:hypothetical protein